MNNIDLNKLSDIKRILKINNAKTIEIEGFIDYSDIDCVAEQIIDIEGCTYDNACDYARALNEQRYIHNDDDIHTRTIHNVNNYFRIFDGVMTIIDNDEFNADEGDIMCSDKQCIHCMHA